MPILTDAKYELAIEQTHIWENTREEQLINLLQKHGLDVINPQNTLDPHPLMEAVFRRIGFCSTANEMTDLMNLRKLKLPIPGFPNREILFWLR